MASPNPKILLTKQAPYSATGENGFGLDRAQDGGFDAGGPGIDAIVDSGSLLLDDPVGPLRWSPSGQASAPSADASECSPGGGCKPHAVFLLSESIFDRVYGHGARDEIGAMADVAPQILTPGTWRLYPEITRKVEWIFSSWSMPVVNQEFLDAFPRLRVIFYAAGSIKEFVSEALWKRGITVTSAFAANAVPVAEFTVAQIVLSLKSVWRTALRIRQEKSVSTRSIPTQGVYNATVGLISLGMIGRLVAEQLRRFQVRVIAFDPYVSRAEAGELGVELCTLDEIFSRSDVVSCHTPLLKETQGMLGKNHFAKMKPYATFMNTARGAVVDEAGLIEVLRERPDLFALLDVTWPEPPVSGSPLYDLPNVILTPHIAGSKNNECRRMARYMAGEAARLLAGKPLLYTVTPELLERMA